MTDQKPILPEQTDCEQLRVLLPAYSIGATDPEETRLVESLLAECPDVAAELEDYVALSQAMLFTSPTVQPPADLHDRILSAVGGGERPPMPRLVPEPQVEIRHTVTPSRRFRISAAMVGLAVVAAMLIITNIYWVLRMNTLRRQQQDALLLLQRRDEALVAATAPDVREIQLVSTAGEQGDVYAVALWTPSTNTAVLRADDLPPLAQNRDYQLWLIAGDTPISAGVFEVDAEGNGIVVFDSDTPLDQYVLGITDEPDGGSTAPTTTPIALSQTST